MVVLPLLGLPVKAIRMFDFLLISINIFFTADAVKSNPMVSIR